MQKTFTQPVSSIEPKNLRFVRAVFEKSQKFSKQKRSQNENLYFSQGRNFWSQINLGVIAYANELPETCCEN